MFEYYVLLPQLPPSHPYSLPTNISATPSLHLTATPSFTSLPQLFHSIVTSSLPSLLQLPPSHPYCNSLPPILTDTPTLLQHPPSCLLPLILPQLPFSPPPILTCTPGHGVMSPPPSVTERSEKSWTKILDWWQKVPGNDYLKEHQKNMNGQTDMTMNQANVQLSYMKKRTQDKRKYYW